MNTQKKAGKANRGKAAHGRGNNIPVPTTKQQKKWNNFQNNVKNAGMKSLYKIMPTIPGKSNQNLNSEAQGSGEPQDEKNVWVPVKTIQTVGGPDNSIPQEQKPIPKFEINRPNLKVIEGSASTIQLNLDKSKGMMAEKVKAELKTEQNEEAKPDVKPFPTAVGKAIPSIQQQNSPQTSGVQGRLTASSFMKVNQPKPLMSIPVMRFPGPEVDYPKAVTGIPRSFLVQKQLEQQQQHQMQQPPNKQVYGKPQPVAGIPRSFLIQQQLEQQQQHQLQQQPSPQMYAKPQGAPSSLGQGPIWEATIQPSPPNTWTPVQSGQTYDQSGQTFDQSGQTYGQGGQGFRQSQEKVFVKVNNSGEPPKQQYSPSDSYEDASVYEGIEEDEQDESADGPQSGSKRLSAFKRLGPLTQPKKPKLTINLLINKEQAVREVVDQSDYPEDDKYTPVHLRSDIQTSLDDTVMKYLVFWPWKKPPGVRRAITARHSKSVMLMELEQMEELYERDSSFFEVLVTGYPITWSKEDVLDAVLESVKGKSFIPCFIEFTRTECKFLVIRSRAALVTIHKYGFVIRKDEVELNVSIMVIMLSVNQIDFIPRLIIRKRLSLAMQGETEINLKEFTTKSDLSHFIYFPLNRVSNQSELMLLQSSVPWESLTRLVLSHNRITSITSFDLPQYTPRLKHLDLSYNYIEAVTALLQCRVLPLNSIVLEGNPLCTDYIEKERYIKVLKMMFSGLKEIDGVRLEIFNDFPETKRNYCPPDAADVVEKVLEVLFPLLDAPPDERHLCEELYDGNAVVTLTFMYKLRYSPIFKDYRSLFARARVMDEGEMETIEGAAEIAKVVSRWPPLEHDPLTFTVDVMYHSDTTTVLRVAGILKITAETLAEDEHLLSFTRTIVLHSLDSVEYKITNEMIYWDLPDKDRARDAFRMTTIRSKNMSLKLESPPDKDLKENLLKIFMKLTDMERQPSEKCLESNDWHLKNALEYFAKLLKLDNLQPLYL